MKFKSKLSFVLIVLFSFFIILCSAGCGDGSSGSGSSGSRRCRNCEVYQNRITSLEQENEELTQNLNSVIVEREKAKDEARKHYMVLSIIAYVALGIGIVLTGSFILMMRSTRKNMPKSAVDNLHCPRCGWEHAAGETVCKNCKTHF